jgi:transcriptional regulator with XRE-family HTH domain
VTDLRVLLGLRIEELRTSLSLNRAELARRVDIEERQIINYERYGAWPKPETLVKLAKGLEVEIHDVLDFSETRRRPQASLEQRLANRT